MDFKKSFLPVLAAIAVATGGCTPDRYHERDEIPRPNFPTNVDGYYDHVRVQRALIHNILTAVRSHRLDASYISFQTSLRNTGQRHFPSENRDGQFISMKLNDDGQWYIIDGQPAGGRTMDEAVSWFGEAARGLLGIESWQILSEKFVVVAKTAEGEFQFVFFFDSTSSRVAAINTNGKVISSGQVEVLADGTVVVDHGGQFSLFFPNSIYPDRRAQIEG